MTKAEDVAHACKQQRQEIHSDLALLNKLRVSAGEKHESFTFVQETLKHFDNVPASFLPKFVKLHAQNAEDEQEVVD